MSANTELFLQARTRSRGVTTTWWSNSLMSEFEPLRAATEGAFKGHEGFRAFLRDTRESFDRFELEYSDVALPSPSRRPRRPRR